MASASRYVGRVGGLSAALGIGAAVIYIGCGTATADSGADTGCAGDVVRRRGPRPRWTLHGLDPTRPDSLCRSERRGRGGRRQYGAVADRDQARSAGARH